MATPTTPPPESAPADSGAEGVPDLLKMAADLAAKHQAGPAGGSAVNPAPVNKGGRRTVAEEAADYCRKNGLRMVPESADGDPAPAAAPAAPPAYMVDPAFVRKLAEAGLKAVEAWRQRAAYQKAVALGAEKEIAREIGEGNGAPPGGIEVMAYSLAEISQKYGWLAQWCPEVAVLMAAGVWLAKDMNTMKRLEELGKQNSVKAEAKPG